MKRLSLILSFFFGLTVSLVSGQTKNAKEKNKDRITINPFGTVNESRFTLFKDNLNKQNKDKFEIWQRTREGDPIITKVKFNGRSVIIKTNSRSDKYANKLDRLIIRRHKVLIDSVKRINTVAELLNL